MDSENLAMVVSDEVAGCCVASLEGQNGLAREWPGVAY